MIFPQSVQPAHCFLSHRQASDRIDASLSSARIAGDVAQC